MISLQFDIVQDVELLLMKIRVFVLRAENELQVKRGKIMNKKKRVEHTSRLTPFEKKWYKVTRMILICIAISFQGDSLLSLYTYAILPSRKIPRVSPRSDKRAADVLCGSFIRILCINAKMQSEQRSAYRLMRWG